MFLNSITHNNSHSACSSFKVPAYIILAYVLVVLYRALVSYLFLEFGDVGFDFVFKVLEFAFVVAKGVVEVLGFVFVVVEVLGFLAVVL